MECEESTTQELQEDLRRLLRETNPFLHGRESGTTHDEVDRPGASEETVPQRLRELGLRYITPEEMSKERDEAERGVTFIEAEAMQAFHQGDAGAFLGYLDNVSLLPFVLHHWIAFLHRGILESARVDALTGTRTNNCRISPRTIKCLLSQWCSRDKLQAGANALPGPGPFIVYRGICGKGRFRRERGLSWTGSLDMACWFAMRYADHLGDPAVYTATVRAKDVFFYTDDRQEREFVCWPKRISPLQISEQDMRSRAAALDLPQ